jgi:signal peptidase I
VGETVQIVTRVLIVSVIVLLCFFFFKHRTSASIETSDKSMDPLAFPEGSYRVNTSIDKLESLKPGDCVAYKVPRGAGAVRIARVIGTEGMKVQITTAGVLSNGAQLPRRFATGQWTIPETKVPRGCVYLLADNPFDAEDSRTLGPVPFTNIVGTVKPSS